MALIGVKIANFLDGNIFKSYRRFQHQEQNALGKDLQFFV
jgi:hypothetical protein